MTADTEPRSRVADVMMTCPKIHGAEATTIVALFEVDHVHMALIVADDGRLLTTIERSDLVALDPASSMAATIGTPVGYNNSIETATTILRCERPRRPGVVCEVGEFLGHLCLKDGTDYCVDENIRDREAESAGRARIAGMTILRPPEDDRRERRPVGVAWTISGVTPALYGAISLGVAGCELSPGGP
jgi:hypothetical protein